MVVENEMLLIVLMKCRGLCSTEMSGLGNWGFIFVPSIRQTYPPPLKKKIYLLYVAA